MNRQVPTLGRLLTMVLFALSCFGLTLFLWLQFGGAVPFKAQGYRITATFPEATSLATEADVRIAGVGIGRVKKVVPGRDGRAIATLEIRGKFAPLPVATKAILRQKTLLGETYVSLTPPAKPSGQVIPEGGRIPNSDIGSTVELDELFATFDPQTRRYFQQWMADAGEGLAGQGGNAGRSLVELQGLVAQLAGLTKTLDEQTPSLRSGLRDATTVFNAAAAQRGALTTAITQTERVFRQTGENDAALTAFVDKLPAFLAALKGGTGRIESFAKQTGPVVTRLEPTAKSLAPATKALTDVAPELRQLLEGIERVNLNAKAGLPATSQTLKALPVVLDGLDPFLKELNPILEYGSLYGEQLGGAIGNLAAVTNSSNAVSTPGQGSRDGNQSRLKYIRAAPTIQASGLTSSPTRFSTDQANAYPRPDFAAKIGQGLPDSYSLQSCGTTVPRVPDSTNAALGEKESVAAGKVLFALPDITGLDAIRYSLFSPFGYFPSKLVEPSAAVAADPEASTPSVSPAPTTPTTAPRDCVVQLPYALTSGRLTTYPQLPAAPTSTERSVTGP